VEQSRETIQSDSVDLGFMLIALAMCLAQGSEEHRYLGAS
jgi:hypothetical protein